MSDQPAIVTANTVTKLGPEHRDNVLVGGSHGGVYAGYLSAKAGARAIILNDAGVGMDQAGISSLAYLYGIGLPGATVDCMSARIGDGEDMLNRGVISHVNDTAADLGCEAGMSTRDCATAMLRAPSNTGDAPSYDEARFLLLDADQGPKVWGVDSASLLRDEDIGQILITASHGALLAGDSGSAARVAVMAACYNDAGLGVDNIGISRLPALDERGIAAATVGCMTARIGECRSSWETGVLNHVNETARAMGAADGMSVPEFADAIRGHAMK